MICTHHLKVIAQSLLLFCVALVTFYVVKVVTEHVFYTFQPVHKSYPIVRVRMGCQQKGKRCKNYPFLLNCNNVGCSSLKTLLFNKMFDFICVDEGKILTLKQTIFISTSATSLNFGRVSKVENINMVKQRKQTWISIKVSISFLFSAKKI